MGPNVYKRTFLHKRYRCNPSTSYFSCFDIFNTGGITLHRNDHWTTSFHSAYQFTRLSSFSKSISPQINHRITYISLKDWCLLLRPGKAEWCSQRVMSNHSNISASIGRLWPVVWKGLYSVSGNALIEYDGGSYFDADTKKTIERQMNTVVCYRSANTLYQSHHFIW